MISSGPWRKHHVVNRFGHEASWKGSSRKEFVMLWTIFVVLLLLWLLGLVSSYTLGGFIHLLLVLALVTLLINIIQGRRVV
jgi:uncharacterized protein DUF5670